MDRQRQHHAHTIAAAALSLLAAAACAGSAVTPPAEATATSVPATAAATASPAPSPAPTPTPDRDPAAYVEGAPYAVTIDPADFVAVVDNPYWPMIPGTTTIFDGAGEHIVVEVTDYSKIVLGVAVTVVRDRVYDRGKLIEDTIDWYAQDRWGNVWYFGEDVVDYEDGKPVSKAGSWEAGVDGAQPGIVMLADPHVGDVCRNEFYAGEAEDLAKVIELGGAIEVPAGTFAETLVTEDWTPLDATQKEHKTYAPGVGLVDERAVGESAAVQLVEVRRP